MTYGTNAPVEKVHAENESLKERLSRALYQRDQAREREQEALKQNRKLVRELQKIEPILLSQSPLHAVEQLRKLTNDSTG